MSFLGRITNSFIVDDTLQYQEWSNQSLGLLMKATDLLVVLLYNVPLVWEVGVV